ncbi:MAG: hypothetical protein JRH16_04230 [Deltaproteobacteria bacterium]|nr:hypothetical protein [Deltaproteobacteria bacterium]MBW2359844.1 hypothetical protein [Deltaproteobacteria bacterium]
MTAGSDTLAGLVRDELTRPAPEAAACIAGAIRDELGPTCASVLFYGSCLRKDTAEGVLDFYAVVDEYAAAGLPRWSHGLPPSVLWIECDAPDGSRLRSKYAVVTADDFARGVAPGGYRTGFWARFCQPALSAWHRDPAALDDLVQLCEQAVLTAVVTIAPLLDDPADAQQFWQRAFSETYRREMRSESPETISSIFDASPERFAVVLRVALDELESRGALPVAWDGARFELTLPAHERDARRKTWNRRRPLAKALYVAQLLQTAFLQTDWLPYALWKVERHTGVPIAHSARQRRHPFIFGWPLLFKILRARQIR